MADTIQNGRQEIKMADSQKKCWNPFKSGKISHYPLSQALYSNCPNSLHVASYG